MGKKLRSIISQQDEATPYMHGESCMGRPAPEPVFPYRGVRPPLYMGGCVNLHFLAAYFAVDYKPSR